MTSKHNESVEFGEKRASVCFESRDMVHELTNSAFLLVFVTTPIDSAHSMHYTYKPCEYYGLVKVVNNANGTRLAAATKADL